jgi:hypothetical protein
MNYRKFVTLKQFLQDIVVALIIDDEGLEHASTELNLDDVTDILVLRRIGDQPDVLAQRTNRRLREPEK